MIILNVELERGKGVEDIQDKYWILAVGRLDGRQVAKGKSPRGRCLGFELDSKNVSSKCEHESRKYERSKYVKSHILGLTC